MQNKNTLESYRKIRVACLSLFMHKTKDYGTSWRVLRPISVVDQLYIKIQRIRTIQEIQVQKIADSIDEELTGVINYSIIGLMQLSLGLPEMDTLGVEAVQNLYTTQFDKAEQLMLLKNHDYGEAWQNMSEMGLVDLMMMKIYRMRQIIANQGENLVSEGLDANYLDLINYAVFTKIRRSSIQKQ